MSVISQQRLRFGDCDTAGIGYYPRLLALVDNAVEDWMAATIGLDRAGLLRGHGLGLPTADLKVGFALPCRLGETLAIAVAPTVLGSASITLAVTASVDGIIRFTGTLVQVLMVLASGAPHAWTPEWRRMIGAQLPAADTMRLVS